MSLVTDAQAVDMDVMGLRESSITAGKTAIYDITVTTDIEAIAPVWLAFEQSAIMSPYQQYGWMAAWIGTIGAAQEIEPLIVLGEDDKGTAFILPLYIKRHGPVHILTWIGGKHTNYNMGLFRPDCLNNLQEADIMSVLQAVKAKRPEIDIIQLENQPFRWNNEKNPLALLRHKPSICTSYSTKIENGFEAYFEAKARRRARKKFRSQTRKLQEAGHAVSIKTSETAADALELFSIFLKQRSERFREQGISNPFEQDGAILFYLDLIHRSAQMNRSLLTFYALQIDGTIRAIFAGVPHQNRFSACITSFSNDDLAQLSPGDFLVHHMIKDRADHGDTAFDFGLGDAQYKRAWCEQSDTMFDVLLPMSFAGRILVQGYALRSSIKATIKQTPILWAIIGKTRQIRRFLGDIKGSGSNRYENQSEEEHLSSEIPQDARPDHLPTDQHNRM